MKIAEFQASIPALRLDVLNFIQTYRQGYVAESLAVLELALALYFAEDQNGLMLRYDVQKPQWADRDYVFWGVPAATPALFLVLQKAGFFSETVGSFCFDQKFPGLDAPLLEGGESLAMACGLARVLSRFHVPSRVMVVLDDAALLSGMVWEMALVAAHERLDPLIVLVGVSGLAKVEPLAAKWEAFGWKVFQVADGHDGSQLADALHQSHGALRRPKVILASTHLGHGIAFMEGREAYRRTAFSHDEIQNLAQNLAQSFS